jgi:predicted ATPase
MITSLTLKDFKCFDTTNKEPIQFSQINLLTGSNGRGKSSVFQALLLLAQSFRNGKNIEKLRLNGRYVKLGTFDDVLRRDSTDRQITIGITSDDDDDNEVSFLCGRDEKNPRTACAKLQAGKIGETLKDIVEVGGNDGQEAANYLARSTSDIKAINQLRNVFFISADRQGPRNYVNREDECSGNVGIHGEYVVHTLKEQEKTILNQVVDAVSTIMGGASITINDVDTEYIKILIDSVDKKNGFKPVNVGFGYSYILPIIVLPLIVEDGAKLFIENPEAHLHPGAQSRLMEFLIRKAKEKNLQLFIETHSDHVINALRIAIKKQISSISKNDAHIIHIGRNPQNSLPYIWQIKIDKNGNLSDYPQEFMDEWTIQMLKLV